MSDRKYSQQHIEEWCSKHFPQVDSGSDDVQLEQKLLHILIKGSSYFDKYPVSTNRTLHSLRPINKYRRYFTNRAKLNYLGFKNFEHLCECDAYKFTNEYLYTTLLRKYVSDAVATESERMLSKYVKKVI